MEIITAIAALCTISVGAMGLSITKVDKAQLKCQKYYSKCVQKKWKGNTVKGLLQCIDEK